jgi:molecular chaperone GrpE
VSRRRNGREDEAEASPSGAATEEQPGEAGLEPREPDATPAAEGHDPLDALRRERDELKEQLLRRRAEFENFRKRVERDRGAAALDAEAALLKHLLGTVDNLERALQAQDAGPALREGVVLTHRDLMTLFESLGVTAIEPLGERFDPSAHQAIQHEPAPGFEPGTVSEVFRKGYRYRDRLLRAALVKVASAPDAGEPGGGDVH